MGDSLLQKAAVTIAAVGILCLFVFSSALEAKEERISSLENMLGEKVKIIGEVKAHEQRGGVQILSIMQQSEMEVVVFGNMSQIKKGVPIEVIGTVQREGNKESVIAQRIRVI